MGALVTKNVFVVLYLMVHCDQFSFFAGDGVGIVVGSVIGSAALLLCMGGISIWAVYQQ